MRSDTSTPTAAYRHMPTDQAKTATTASAARSPGRCGCSVAAEAATDCAATTQMNQVPLALTSTGRSARASTAVHGITYPSSSHEPRPMPSRTAAATWCPSMASRTPSTFPPAMNVKNPNARAGSVKSETTASRWATTR